MSEYYFAIFTAIVAIFSSYFTHRMTLGREKLKIEIENQLREVKDKKNKLEELYLIVDEWATAFGSLHIPLISVMKNEISYNDALDYFIEEKKNHKTDYKKIEMLIDLNFRELKDDFKLLLKKRDSINKIIESHKIDYKQGQLDGSKYLDPFIKNQLEFYQQIELFKESISKYSVSISKVK